MKHKLYCGVGIENGWMAQTDRPGKRLLDVFLQMKHYDRWLEDLRLAKDLGINAIRYSVPWYISNPRAGRYDWDWIARPIEWLVRNGVTPIIDLIHYGTPTWMEDGILNDAFPERFAEYAFAFARRFSPGVSHYTPVNEPQTSASLSGHKGVWPPYLQGVEGWSRLCLPLARALVLSSRALRDAVDQPVLISADCTFTPSWREIATAAGQPDLEPRGDDDLLLSFFPASLAYGRIDCDSPLARCLSRIGFKDGDFEWFKEHAQTPDIFGFNFYPDPKVVQSGAAEEDLLDFLRRIRLTFDLPLYITETSSGLDDPAKVRWIESIGRVFTEARARGLPLLGVNWWPLFNTIQWDFRDNGKPVEECIVPGGWNNGLYVINTEIEGALERVPTKAVSAYKKLANTLLSEE